jgi:glycosyltransferase involved in cell wall biosynthesis
MDRVEHSILAEACVDRKVIPYGIDLDVFKPTDKRAARSRLGLPQDRPVLLFAAVGLTSNPWKDYDSLIAALHILGQRELAVEVIALGEEGTTERHGAATIRFVPYERSADTVAAYYQAADLYVHPARVDTFPNVVLEALACGTPVVATAVGGIPEQVRGLSVGIGARNDLNRFAPDEATGVLCELGNVAQLAQAIERVVTSTSQLAQMGSNAARDARQRFALTQMVNRYASWFGGMESASHA